MEKTYLFLKRFVVYMLFMESYEFIFVSFNVWWFGGVNGNFRYAAHMKKETNRSVTRYLDSGLTC